LLIVEELDIEFLEERLNAIRSKDLNLLELGIYDKVLNKFETLIAQAEILSSKYDIYVTNPPYLSSSKQTTAVKNYLTRYYKNYKSDLFSSFIKSSHIVTKKSGHIGFMSPYVWMFISTYEILRNKIINDSTITSLVQLEYSGFDGATVPICTFTLKNIESSLLGEYIRLTDFIGAKKQPIKTKEAVRNSDV